MNDQLFGYIKDARDRGLSDPVIKSNLVVAGWDAHLAEAGLTADLSFPAPAVPIEARLGAIASNPTRPVAVVSNFTTRGLEYIIMFIAMAVTAVSLGLVLHSLVDTLFNADGDAYDGIVSYATSALVVALPVFAALFLRLKKAELSDTTLLEDPSRKHAVQLTLIITFIIGIWKVITYVYSLLNAGNGSVDAYGSTQSLGGNLIHTLITLAIAGGIFAYYWRDSHKSREL